jgi:hypothetical protein
MEVQAWLDHPIVRHARGSLPVDAQPLDLLEATLGVMLELERRFPGIPFGELLGATDTDVDTSTLRARLARAGVSTEDMALVVPDMQSRRKYSEAQLGVLRSKFEARRCTVKQFAKENDMSKSTIFRLIKGDWSYT